MQPPHRICCPHHGSGKQGDGDACRVSLSGEISEVRPPRIYYERARAASGASSFVFKEKYEYSLPDPTRPGPITIFKSLYLRNRMSDRQAVFFDEYHLDVKVVRHGWGIPAQIDQSRDRFNIIMSAISIKFAALGYSWTLITNIKLAFEYFTV